MFQMFAFNLTLTNTAKKSTHSLSVNVVMNSQAWSSQFVTKIFADTHQKRGRKRSGVTVGLKKAREESEGWRGREEFSVWCWRRRWRKLQNCKTPLSGHLHGHPTRVERRVQPGADACTICVCVLYVCVCVLCLLRIHWPGVNWIMFAAQLKLEAV